METRIQTFQKDDDVFAEGQWADVAYIIKTGRVEISLQRKGRNVLLGTMGPGSCFGEMAPIIGGKRTANAIAKTSTLAYEIDANYLKHLVDKTEPILKSIILSLIERVKRQNRNAGFEIRYDNAIISCAHGLALIGEQYDPDDDGNITVDLNETSKTLSEISGRSVPLIKEVLAQMKDLGLARSIGKGMTANLSYHPSDIELHAQGLTKILGDDPTSRFMSTADAVNIHEIAEILHTDANVVLKTLFQAGNLKDLIFLRTQETIDEYCDATGKKPQKSSRQKG